MISVIHPSASHFPAMGSGAPRVPTHPGHQVMTTSVPQPQTIYGQGLMMAAKAGEQISNLYRRRDSGYTHHVSTSSYPPSVVLGAPAAQPPALLQPTQRTSSLSSYLSAVASSSRGKKSVVNPAPVPQKKSRGLVFPNGGQQQTKDFSKPLFVDCSIEYELPNAPKIPKNSLPILMIHPGYKARPSGPAAHQKMASSSVAHNKESCGCHSGEVKKPRAVAAPTGVSAAPKRTAAKRSYETAMSNDFYKRLSHPLQAQQQAAAPSYFDSTNLENIKRIRLAEKQQQQQQQQMLQQQHHHYQMAFRHYQQSYYRTTRDMRISSFQQITPPESLAFWQQQQQHMTSQMCRSGCCTGTPGPAATRSYIPTACPAAPLCCYALPPTPMVTNNGANNAFCLGCAQGKCQLGNSGNNGGNKQEPTTALGIMRSL